jgi:steroid delta-isomerase
VTDAQAARRYAAFYENLTPDSLDYLEELCAPDVRFRDPFNDVSGVAAYRRALEKMFAEVSAPRFVVEDYALSQAACYLRWTFRFEARGRTREIVGMSEVRFDASSRVTSHVDYWDPSPIYAMVPVLRTVLQFLRRRLGVRG